MGNYGPIAIVDVSPKNAQHFSKNVAGLLKVDPNECIVSKFADGETKVHVGKSIRGKDVYIFQTYQEPQGEKIYELLNAVSATRGEADRVTAVMPYCFGMRGERPTGQRQSVQLEVVVRSLYSMGIERIITIGLHTDTVITVFKVVGEKKGIKVEQLSFELLAANYIILDAQQKNYESVVVASTDAGGFIRVDSTAQIISKNSIVETNFVIGIKRRTNDDKTEVVGLIGDVEGKSVYPYDDVGDTFGSMLGLVNQLEEHGAKEIMPILIHPVFGKGYERNLEKLCENALVREIVFGNTLPLKGIALTHPKVKTLPLEPFVAEAIRRINGNKSMSELHQYNEIVKIYQESNLENKKYVHVGKSPFEVAR